MSNENDARPASDDPPLPPANAEDKQSRTQFRRNKPGIRTPLKGIDEPTPKSNLVYGIQIFRASVIFVVGCSMACELTGIRLWRSLEKTI